ncbi:Rne/Rng family ribonuclease [Actinospongicola halichondriae]|uniref:Rne/Rng family ribonuclease n=1 Tax=Actinospongicola halichondriae TaxID=3236844 RepID=UPI003D51043E
MTDTHTGSATPNERPEGAAAEGSGASPDRPPAPAENQNKPKIGDTRAAPPSSDSGETSDGPGRQRNRSRGRGGQGKQKAQGGEQKPRSESPDESTAPAKSRSRRRRRGKGRGQGNAKPVELATDIDAVELDADQLEARKGKHRDGKPVGRYTMAVHKTPKATQIAVLEGRTLIEHYVSRPADDISQIHGNIYLAKVANVLPGMEAAFVDIGTPKNAVLYRSDVSYDPDDVEGGGKPRIEDVLKAKQTIICQVTKNPIGVKGARLTQEVSLPGRFVVLVPNSGTYGISKRLPDNERKRLRKILDGAKPKQHGVIVRTAAENVTSEEIANDVKRLVSLWDQIEALAKKSQAPTLLYREPDVAVRVIREEFSKDYRSVVIDDKELYDDALDYVSGITPALADRVQYYDLANEKLPLFERHHVHEQLHKALDRKVWLPSGGSLIIEHTEALTVIDVNTGKNVGKSNLEDTVYKNNLEAAEAIAHQLRLRDIGGIIVIDFIDMEIKKNREDVARSLREALARDKTRTQVFDISELGLVEMTRKRIGEGLLDSFTDTCEICDGRGTVIDQSLLSE